MATGFTSPNSFRFQPNSQAVSPRDIITRGLSAEQELYGGPGPTTPNLPEDIANIEGVTSEIMDQWGEAKNFADMMWHNYRIDVTKPDARNPLAVQAAQAFSKQMAALQYSGLKLKQYNELVGKAQAAVIEGKGEMLQDPSQGYYTHPGQFFASNRIDPMVTEANKYNVKISHDKSTVGALNKEQERVIKDLTQRYQAALERGDIGTAQEYKRDIEAMQKSVYQVDDALQLEAYKNRQGADQTRGVIDEVIAMRAGLADGSKNDIARITMALKRMGYSDAVVTARGFDGVRGIRIQTSEKAEPLDIKFDPNDTSTGGGLKNLFDLLSMLEDPKYRIPSNQMAEYLADPANASKGLEMESPKGYNLAKDNMEVILSMKSKKDTEAGLGAEKITAEDKQQMFNMLDDLSRAGKLRGRDNEILGRILWEGSKLIFVPKSAMVSVGGATANIDEATGMTIQTEDESGDKLGKWDEARTYSIDLNQDVSGPEIAEFIQNNEEALSAYGQSTTPRKVEQKEIGTFNAKSDELTLDKTTEKPKQEWIFDSPEAQEEYNSKYAEWQQALATGDIDAVLTLGEAINKLRAKSSSKSKKK